MRRPRRHYTGSGVVNGGRRRVRATGSTPAPAPVASVTILNDPLPDGADAFAPKGTMAMATFPDDGASTFDPTKVVLTVTDPGFDTSGNPTTRQRTLRGTVIVRRQYANQVQRLNSASAGTRIVYFALDDDIYSAVRGAVVTGIAEAGFYGPAAAGSLTITNNSLRAYPKAQWAWVNQQHDRETGADVVVEGAGLHRWAMFGQQFACVQYQARDAQASPNLSAVVTVSAPVLSTKITQGFSTEVYRGQVSQTNLTQADLCRMNARVYPWIGDADAVLDLLTDGSGVTGAFNYATQYTPLRFLCDKAGTYGGAWVAVKAGASGGTVQASEAAAAATPFPTINAAIAALPAWNNTNKGHNDHSGATVALMDDGVGGAVAHSPTASSAAVAIGKCFTRVVAYSGNTAAVSLNLAATWAQPGLLDYRVNITHSAGSGLDGSASGDKLLALNGITVDSNGSAIPVTYRNGYVFCRNVTQINVTNTAGSIWRGFSAARMHNVLMAGIVTKNNSGSVLGRAHAIIGCDCSRTVIQDDTTVANDPQDGLVVLNSQFLNTDTTFSIAGAQDYAVRGFGIGQVVIERARIASAPALHLGGDGTTKTILNANAHHLTVPGADNTGRSNVGYVDVAGAVGVVKEITFFGCLFSEYNSKHDVFVTNTTLTGRTQNWRGRHWVGRRGNHIIVGSSEGGNPTVPNQSGDNWLGETFAHASNTAGAAVAFVNDKSGVAGTGDGNYRPTGASSPAYNKIAATTAKFKYDLDGLPRLNDGTGACGAFERAA